MQHEWKHDTVQYYALDQRLAELEKQGWEIFSVCNYLPTTGYGGALEFAIVYRKPART